VPDVPEVSAPGDQELGVSVTDPGGPAPDQGVGHCVAPQFVEVDHPDPVMRIRSDVDLATTRTGIWDHKNLCLKHK